MPCSWPLTASEPRWLWIGSCRPSKATACLDGLLVSWGERSWMCSDFPRCEKQAVCSNCISFPEVSQPFPKALLQLLRRSAGKLPQMAAWIPLASHTASNCVQPDLKIYWERKNKYKTDHFFKKKKTPSHWLNIALTFRGLIADPSLHK